MRLTLTQKLVALRKEYDRCIRRRRKSEEVHKEMVEVMRRILKRENSQDRRKSA